MVRADPGRAKTCFYGTMNLHTGQVLAQQVPTLNAVTTATHLEHLLAAYPDVPLLLLWDRAPWHRGQAIRDVLAAHPRLEVLALPVAAPDLNPQEQVWKATRQAVSHHHTMLTLPSVAAQFEQHLLHTVFATSFLEHRGFDTICSRLNC